MTPDECSQCGADIPEGALSCPGCGADERTGWDENPYLPGEEVLPDDDEWEEGKRPPVLPGERWTPPRWIIVAAIVALALVYIVLQHSAIWSFRQD